MSSPNYPLVVSDQAQADYEDILSVTLRTWGDRQLTTHACQPAYQYRHRWRVGDAVLWDNRRVLHAGTFYNMATETRLMHRTTFCETEPV